MQALRLIDELMHYHGSGVVQLEVDNPGVLSTLQSFYVLTFDQSNDNRGRRAVVRVLSYENNLNSILPFVELTSNTLNWEQIFDSVCVERVIFLKTTKNGIIKLKNQRAPVTQRNSYYWSCVYRIRSNYWKISVINFWRLAAKVKKWMLQNCWVFWNLEVLFQQTPVQKLPTLKIGRKFYVNYRILRTNRLNIYVIK